jgi:hypothetical protein
MSEQVVVQHSERQIDYDAPGRNMYGLKPCPKCASVYRWPTRPDNPRWPSVIRCDDCDSNEPLTDTP